MAVFFYLRPSLPGRSFFRIPLSQRSLLALKRKRAKMFYDCVLLSPPASSGQIVFSISLYPSEVILHSKSGRRNFTTEFFSRKIIRYGILRLFLAAFSPAHRGQVSQHPSPCRRRSRLFSLKDAPPSAVKAQIENLFFQKTRHAFKSRRSFIFPYPLRAAALLLWKTHSRNSFGDIIHTHPKGG